MEQRGKIEAIVGVLLVRDGKVLLGKRKNTPVAAHYWTCPGGHVEYGEHFEDCARREVMEEVGVSIKNLKMAPPVEATLERDNTQFVTIFYIAEIDQGEVRLCEPDLYESWEWFSWDNMPNPLFPPMAVLVERGFKVQ